MPGAIRQSIRCIAAHRGGGGDGRFGSRIDDCGAPRCQACPQLRARRSGPRTIARTRHYPGRYQVRHALEEEVVMKIQTKAVHAGDRKKAGPHAPVTTPIYTASSYFYETMEELDRAFSPEH